MPGDSGYRADEENGPARHLIEAGSDLVGVTSGVAFGLVVGSPEAVLAGAAAGSALTSVLRDFGRRLLGHREQVRVGAVATFARMAYEQRVAAGDHLRDDNWFEERPSGRSIAAEICEGTLLTAQREHEERKIQYYGYLLANLSFEPNIDEYLANWLLQLANQLTLAQLVLLAMIGRKDNFDLPAVTIGTGADTWTPWGLHEQLADLGYAKRELIGPHKGEETFGTFPGRVNRELPSMELRNAGLLIYQLMWLDRIPSPDIQTMIERLRPPGASR
jgi:hypothetical protein